MIDWNMKNWNTRNGNMKNWNMNWNSDDGDELFKITENEYKALYASDSNEPFEWQEYDDRVPVFEDMIITIFKMYAVKGTGNKVIELPRQSIPAYYPRLLKDFYQKCAPVRLSIGNLTFFPYDHAFEIADRSHGQILLIGYKGQITRGSTKNIIYMDKNWDGNGYDPRVQLDVGNQQVQILGSNIFTFISMVVENVMDLELE